MTPKILETILFFKIDRGFFMSSFNPLFHSSDSLEGVMTVSFLNEAHRACFAFFYYRNRASLDDGFNTLTAIDYILTAYGEPNQSMTTLKAAAEKARCKTDDEPKSQKEKDMSLLFSFMRDLAVGTESVTTLRLLIPGLTSENAFFLIVNALIILRWGKRSINPQDLNIKEAPF